MPKYKPVRIPEKCEYPDGTLVDPGDAEKFEYADGGNWHSVEKSNSAREEVLRQRCLDIAIRIGNFDNNADQVIEDARKIENYLRGTSADL